MRRTINLKFNGVTSSGSRLTGETSVDVDCSPTPGTPVPWQVVIDTGTPQPGEQGECDDDNVSEKVTTKDPAEEAEVFAVMDPALC